MNRMICALLIAAIAAGCGAPTTSGLDLDEEHGAGSERGDISDDAGDGREAERREPLPFYVGEWVQLEQERDGNRTCVHDAIHLSLNETRFVMSHDGGDNGGIGEGDVVFDGTTATLRPDDPFIIYFACSEAELTSNEGGGLHFEGRDCDREAWQTSFDLEPVPRLPELEIPEELVGYFESREALVEVLGPDGVEVVHSETVPTDDCRGPGGHWTLTLGVEGEADQFAARWGWHGLPGQAGGLEAVDSDASEALFLFVEGPSMCRHPGGVALRYDFPDGRIVAEHLYQRRDSEDIDGDGIYEEGQLTRWTHTLVAVEERPSCD